MNGLTETMANSLTHSLICSIHHSDGNFICIFMLNMEGSYKREERAPFERIVCFLTDQFEWRMPS